MNHLQRLIIKIFNTLHDGFTLSPKQVFWYINAYKERYTMQQVYNVMKSLDGKYIEKVGDKRKTITAKFKPATKTLNKIKDYY